jgi:hypothetical protein
MNKLQRDIILRAYAQVVLTGSFVCLGLFKLIQILSGLSEQDMYRRHPASWWIAVSLGFLFISALVYSVKKTVDIHPDIQLRAKPDDVLLDVLADPKYKLWHQEAQRILDKRKETQQ